MKEQDYLEFGQMYRSLKKCCRNVRWKTSVTQYELNALKNTAKVTDTIKGGKYKLLPYQEYAPKPADTVLNIGIIYIFSLSRILNPRYSGLVVREGSEFGRVLPSNSSTEILK